MQQDNNLQATNSKKLPFDMLVWVYYTIFSRRFLKQTKISWTLSLLTFPQFFIFCVASINHSYSEIQWKHNLPFSLFTTVLAFLKCEYIWMSLFLVPESMKSCLKLNCSPITAQPILCKWIVRSKQWPGTQTKQSAVSSLMDCISKEFVHTWELLL